MTDTKEAFARVKIDALLKDAGWDVTDGTSVLFEHTLPDRSRSDYVLCDRVFLFGLLVGTSRTTGVP